METILDYAGRVCYLSDEVYEITDPEVSSMNTFYRAGVLVRKISGVDGRSTPGYHFKMGWTTVCRIDVIGAAQFHGVETKYLKKLNARQLRKLEESQHVN